MESDSLLALAQKAREHRLDIWGYWLYITIAIVFIGLLLEYGPELVIWFTRALRESRHRRLKKTSAFPFAGTRNIPPAQPISRRANRWAALVTAIGAASVVIGVVGEGLTEYEATGTEGTLRSIVHKREDLRSLALTNAEKVLAQTQKQAAEAQEKLQTTNRELERIMLPRHITGINADWFPFKKLKEHRGTKALLLSVPDVEAIKLTGNILGVLQQWAGWSATAIILQGADSIGVPDGVDIATPACDLPHPPVCHAIHDAAWALSVYLDSPGTGEQRIDNKPDGFSVNNPEKGVVGPKWWPPNFVPQQNTICIFVGLKPVTEQIESKEWIDANSNPNARRFFQNNFINGQ